MGQPLSKKRISGQGRRLGKHSRKGTFRSMTGACKMLRIGHRIWKKDGQKRHVFTLMFSHRKTTRTLRCAKNAYGFYDLGASPETKRKKIRQQLANVNSRAHIPPHNEFRRDPKSQSEQQRPQPHAAHLPSPLRLEAKVQTNASCHNWWSSFTSKWWHGCQDWDSS